MRRRPALVAALALSLAGASLAAAATGPANWDGLSRINSKKFDAVYLLPDADFRTYSKAMLDPTEVAFEKNWLRRYNQDAEFSRRLSESEAQQALGEVRQGFEEIFQKAYGSAGYPITQTAGPDVLRVRTAVVNLNVVAPDVLTAGRSRTFSQEAGGATLIVEVRDSLTGALLGRAVDSQTVGYGAPYMRNSVTNRSDFERVFSRWAKRSVEGLAELKANSPISAGVAAK